MSRRKHTGGRTTRPGTRPLGSTAKPQSGHRHRPHSPPKALPPLHEILLAVSSQLMDLMPMASGFAVPDRAGLAAAVEAEIGDQPALIPVFAIAAELLQDQRLQSVAASRIGPDMGHIDAMLAELSGAEAYDPFETREPFDEARHLSFGVRFPRGEELSVLVLVEHRGNMQLADGFVLGQPIEEIRRVTLKDPDLTITDTNPADIRRQLDQAVDGAYRTLPPPMTETWPAEAILIEWAKSKLPDPGLSPDWEPMSDDKQESFLKAFLASDEYRSIKAKEAAIIDAVSTMLWFKDGYTNNDPFRWGPGQVEFFLGDWALRKVIGDDAGLRVYPSVLRALIPWCHRQIGLEPRLTAQTLEAVDDMEPIFSEELRPGRPQGVDALIQATRPFLSDGMTEDDDSDLDTWWANRQAQRRTDAVGGPEHLRTLTAAPLPPGEIPSVDHLDSTIRPRAIEVATGAARVADELYGPEFDTAAARLAIRLFEADPKALVRGRLESAIAAVVWMAASANGLRWSVTLADIQRATNSAANPKDRARTLTRALGCEFTDIDDLLLGTTELLVSRRRQQLIDEEAAGPDR